MKARKDRQEMIRQIVRNSQIRTQHELVEVLSRKGHPCTQATISRDVEELGLTKTREGHYVLAEDQHLQRMVHGLTDSVARTGNLVLIHAQGGTAPGVAGAIDLAHMDGVMGTVSGDTTVLVVCENEDKAASVEDKIRYFTNSELKI